MPYLARMACLAALLTGLAYADADLPNTTAGYNRIQLAAEARRDVPNDTLNATLFTEEAHADPARLARQLNDKVSAALRLAAGVSQVKTSSGTLSTWPVYEANNRLTGWRGRRRCWPRAQRAPSSINWWRAAKRWRKPSQPTFSEPVDTKK